VIALLAYLNHLYVYQISRESDGPFPLYGNFHALTKRRKKKKENDEIKPIFESLYLRNTWRDLVEIWNVEY